jgi:predicted TPR repeat methyltransferase
VDDTTYMTWKGWTRDAFGAVPPGSRHYFDQLFRGTLRAGQAALEIGFGNGALLTCLREAGLDVVGTEINERLVEVAAAAGFLAFLGAPQTVPALRDRKFDLIVGIDVAEHMTQGQLHHLFEWVRDHLAAGGRMVLRFPEGASPLSMANQNGDFTHVTYLTRTKVESLALATGLRLTDYRDDVVSSNRLCSLGWIGKLVLHLAQLYARVLSAVVRALLAPLNTPLRLTANSVAVLEAAPRDRGSPRA